MSDINEDEDMPIIEMGVVDGIVYWRMEGEDDTAWRMLGSVEDMYRKHDRLTGNLSQEEANMAVTVAMQRQLQDLKEQNTAMIGVVDAARNLIAHFRALKEDPTLNESGIWENQLAVIIQTINFGLKYLDKLEEQDSDDL